MTRVLIVTSFPIPGEFDGTAMLPIKIARALRARRIEVVLAYLKARRPWSAPRTGDFEGIPLYSLSPPWWITGLRTIWRRHQLELVHAQHYGGATRAYPACRMFGWPLVYEIHSLLGDEVERDRLGCDAKFRAYVALEKRVLRRAAHVIVLGEPVKDVVVREKHVAEDRVSVIYPGIDLAEYEHPHAPVEIPGVDSAHRVVMYVGSIVHPNQGVPILIDALPRVFEARPDARCVLVGGPEEAAAVHHERLGVQSRKLVVLAGKRPEEVVCLTRRADVLVHSRLPVRENYSVQSKLAVYLAAGRPIVATDFGDYRMLLGETGAGVLTAADPESVAQGILRVLGDPELAARLSLATRDVAREYFCMNRNIDRYLDVYDLALALPRR